MDLKTRIDRDYAYLSAGRFWVVPELTVTIMPDGSEGISLSEIRRTHRAIANYVCGAPGPLSWADFDFLCTLTDTRYNAVAEHLSLHKSTVTRWRRADAVPQLASLALKRWFWLHLFGEELRGWRVPVNQLGDDQSFLARARARAISEELVESVAPRAA